MPEIKSQPMPGLCALCCAAVLLANDIAVATGIADETHELPQGSAINVLQDMASGEWAVNEIHADGEIRPMAAVTFVGGLAVCASDVLNAMRMTYKRDGVRVALN